MSNVAMLHILVIGSAGFFVIPFRGKKGSAVRVRLFESEEATAPMHGALGKIEVAYGRSTRESATTQRTANGIGNDGISAALRKGRSQFYPGTRPSLKAHDAHKSGHCAQRLMMC